MQGHIEWRIDQNGEIDTVMFYTEQGNLLFTPRYNQRPFMNTPADRAKIAAKLKAVLGLYQANIDQVQ